MGFMLGWFGASILASWIYLIGDAAVWMPDWAKFMEFGCLFLFLAGVLATDAKHERRQEAQQ